MSPITLQGIVMNCNVRCMFDCKLYDAASERPVRNAAKTRSNFSSASVDWKSVS